MHDPLTQAFQCKIPWGWHENSKGFRHRKHIYLFTIWHVDPEKDGSDDSCGWSSPRLTEAEKAKAKDLIFNEHDNVKSWFGEARDDEERSWQVMRLFRIFKRQARPWWQHPRWHVHHWRVQVPVVQTFQRWAFSRCSRCGKGFRWGYSPTTDSWNGTGPRWFRSEENTYHSDCRDTKSNGAQAMTAVG